MSECSNPKCCCSHEQEELDHDNDLYDDKTEWLLEVADLAWAEVLKEKIKEHILANQNEHMTELAKIVSEGNHELWKYNMANQQADDDFKEKLCNFYHSKK